MARVEMLDEMLGLGNRIIIRFKRVGWRRGQSRGRRVDCYNLLSRVLSRSCHPCFLRIYHLVERKTLVVMGEISERLIGASIVAYRKVRSRLETLSLSSLFPSWAAFVDFWGYKSLKLHRKIRFLADCLWSRQRRSLANRLAINWLNLSLIILSDLFKLQSSFSSPVLIPIDNFFSSPTIFPLFLSLLPLFFLQPPQNQTWFHPRLWSSLSINLLSSTLPYLNTVGMVVSTLPRIRNWRRNQRVNLWCWSEDQVWSVKSESRSEKLVVSRSVIWKIQYNKSCMISSLMS